MVDRAEASVLVSLGWQGRARSSRR